MKDEYMIKFEKDIAIKDQVKVKGRPLSYAWPELEVGDSFGVANRAALRRGLGAAKAYSSRHNLGWELVWGVEALGFRVWRRA